MPVTVAAKPSAGFRSSFLSTENKVNLKNRQKQTNDPPALGLAVVMRRAFSINYNSVKPESEFASFIIAFLSSILIIK